uniref:Uncharacterized protein n=1 Tax=Timema poppense TaxID=170557 RepID=A0A7R9DJE9_TIMPO|nr:unnamed protein product [Timema poppensis]
MFLDTPMSEERFVSHSTRHFTRQIQDILVAAEFSTVAGLKHEPGGNDGQQSAARHEMCSMESQERSRDNSRQDEMYIEIGVRAVTTLAGRNSESPPIPPVGRSDKNENNQNRYKTKESENQWNRPMNRDQQSRPSPRWPTCEPKVSQFEGNQRKQDGDQNTGQRNARMVRAEVHTDPDQFDLIQEHPVEPMEVGRRYPNESRCQLCLFKMTDELGKGSSQKSSRELRREGGSGRTPPSKLFNDTYLRSDQDKEIKSKTVHNTDYYQFYNLETKTNKNQKESDPVNVPSSQDRKNGSIDEYQLKLYQTNIMFLQQIIAAVIIKAGERKLRTMHETTNFRRGILCKEWEHKKLRMEIEDLKEHLHTLEGIKVR